MELIFETKSSSCPWNCLNFNLTTLLVIYRTMLGGNPGVIGYC